jgi:hypothetical protein
MHEIYRQMEADGKIGPLMPPDATGMRHARPHAEYPKMLRPPKFERQERVEPGPGGHPLRMWQWVEIQPAVVARSRREELDFMQDGVIEPLPEGTDAVIAERDALRMENEDMKRRLERLESLMLAQSAQNAGAPVDPLAKLATIGKETANV